MNKVYTRLATLLVASAILALQPAEAQSSRVARGTKARPATDQRSLNAQINSSATPQTKADQGAISAKTASVGKSDAPDAHGTDALRGGPPANDNCAGAITLTPAATCIPVNGDVFGATQTIAAITCNTFTGNADNDVWFKFVATSTSHTIVVDGSLEFDAVVDLRSGACNGTNIGCADATVEDGIEQIVAGGLSIGATYYIRVYDYYALEPLTTTFTICVYGVPPPPPNDQCSSAVAQNLAVGGSLNFNGTTAGATTTNDAVVAGLMDDGVPKVWHKFTTSTCANVTVEYCGTTPAFDQIYIVLNSSCPADAYVVGTYEFTSCGDNNGTIVFTGLPAGTYYIPVGLFGAGSTGGYMLTVSATACAAPPVNDDCAGAITLTPATVCNPVTGDVAGSTQSLAPITCATFTSAAAFDVWYKFVATSTSQTVHVDGDLNFDAVVDLRSGACNGTNIACADATLADEIEEIPATGLTIGATYYVRVYSYGGVLPVTTTFDICIITPGAAPPNDGCGSVAFTPLNAGATITFTGDNTGATMTGDYVPGSQLEALGLGSVWHAFTTTECTDLTVQYCGLAPVWGDVWVILATSCPADDNLIFNTSWNDTDCGDGNVTIYYDDLPAGSYYFPVMLDAGLGSIGAYSIDVSAVSCAGVGPVNDDCGSVTPVALNVGGTVNFTGDNTGATATGDAVPGTLLDDGTPIVWHAFTTSVCTDVAVEYCGTAPAFGNVYIVLVTGCPANDPAIFSASFNDTDCGDANWTVYYTNLPAGTYYLPVLTEPGSTGPYTIDVSATSCSAPPANNDCGGAIGLAVNLPADCPANAVSGDNSAATQDLGDPSCDLTTGLYQDVWYTFYSGANTTVTVTFNQGTMTDWVVVLYDACAGTEVPGTCTIQPLIPFDVTVNTNTTYWVRIYSNTQFGVGGQFSICLSAAITTAQVELQGSSSWSVFPNPGNGALNVVWSEASALVTIELFDLGGRAVFAERVELVQGAAHPLALTEQLAQGTYSLRLTGPEGVSEQRVVVQ